MMFMHNYLAVRVDVSYITYPEDGGILRNLLSSGHCCMLNRVLYIIDHVTCNIVFSLIQK